MIIFLKFLLLLLFCTSSLALNPYQVLGISRSSNIQTVNKALKRMAMIYRNDSNILSLLKEAYGQIKMYQLLDRGVHQPKKHRSKPYKNKYNLKDISVTDYMKLTAYIFCNLLPITLLIYCITKRSQTPRNKQIQQIINAQNQKKNKKVQPQPSAKVTEPTLSSTKEKELKKQEIYIRKMKIIKDACYFEKQGGRDH